ncbi:tetratricopeptide repeat-containing sensor histidine kinase [Xanthocytophaga agilis]|uniref:histidine kinase n=1 Tax=Xanthocytophaga agilis TaxID=3048010 RepID=A0AAE3UG82_9BACT|nr:tetratricopeptide repeat-containing sensor histidine kinase [Xanthocytophaga agilis]MDJ1504628.1 tetratricopeptide repeat-containing sensor histidine kinase [Xanthocytophaga agilis]
MHFWQTARIGLFIAVLVVNSIVLSAQTPNVDTLNAQAQQLLENSPEQSLRLSLQSVQLALKTNYLSGHTKALNLAGQGYYRLNNYKKSLQYFSQALDKALIRRQDPEAADAYEYLGQAYFGFGDYDQSLSLFFKSLRIREKIRDKKGTAQSLTLIGSVYEASGKLDKALEYYQKALKLWTALEDTTGLAIVYNYLGQLYDKRSEYTQALEYLANSLSIYQKQKSERGISQALHSIGEVYFHQKKYDFAINYYFRALKREQRLQLLHAVARSYNSIAACYYETSKYQQAIFYYEKAIVKGRRAQTRDPLMNAYLGLASSQDALKNYKDAYINHRIYSQIRDSIFNARTNVEIAEVEAKYLLENQQQEVELLRKEKRINTITLRENRNLTYLMGVLLVALLFLAIVLISRFRIKQRSGHLLESRNQIIHTQNVELQQTNLKLTESEASLRSLIATKDKFFTIVSHDLRGPLNSLASLFQVLINHIDHFDKNELKKFVQDMNTSVKSVLDLVENLLHWSRTQRGGIRYEPELLELDHIMHELLSTVSVMASNKGINILLDISSDIHIYADKNMLLFTLRNLTDNAIKFSHIGDNVSISTNVKDNLVEIAITDNGIGISPNDLQKLFRIDTYHTTNGTANESGTGLGLILCQEFVNRNGGEIGVDSIVGKGTTFWFTVPVYVLTATEK